MTSAAVWGEILQQGPAGYLVTSATGRVELANDSFLALHRLDAADVVGQLLTELMPVGDQIFFRTHCLPQLGLRGRVDAVSVEIVGGDGVRRPVLLSAVVAPGPDATTRSLVALLATPGRPRRHDPLTGLTDRSGLVDALPGLLSSDGVATVLVLEVDGLAAVNASLGHAAGDQVLRRLAGRLRDEVPDGGALARLAGSELALATTVPDAAAVDALCERVLAATAVPTLVHGEEVTLTGTVGVSVADAPTDTPEQLLRRAVVANQAARSAGGGRWHLHRSADPDLAAGRLRLVTELRRAVAGTELTALYQPRVDLRTGRVDGVESLVRWYHPVRGLLGPEHFIDAAETSGLVQPLGVRVLDLALAQAARWRAGPERDLARTVAVNLSARQLGEPTLLAAVRDALERHEVEPTVLTLEITETALATDPTGAQRALRALKDLGVGVAVDDFGTGYASLTYLKQFPVDELKVDRLFVSGVAHDEGDRAIVDACVRLAHGVGATAVAEGVETAEQQRIVTDLGCDVAQGFLFARPMEADALTAWARQPR